MFADQAAFQASTGEKDWGGGSVTRAMPSVFGEGAAEFGEGHDEDTVEQRRVREIVAEGGDGLGEFAQRDRMVDRLVGMIVELSGRCPALFHQENANSEIGADELRHGLEGLGQRKVRIWETLCGFEHSGGPLGGGERGGGRVGREIEERIGTAY